MQFTRHGDITLHYQEIGGPEDKPALVFLNSLGTDFRIWRDVVVTLAGQFHILTYDMRGHGLSDTGQGPCSIDDLVADLKHLLDLTGVGNAVLCGVSMGGQLAMGFYGQHPERVAALILSDTAHKIGDNAFWNTRIDKVKSEGIASIADGILERWFAPDYRCEPNAEFSGYRNMLERQDRQGYAAACAAVRDTDLTETAKRIAVPTLCVVGDQDGSTPPELVKELAALIPGARYEVIEGAGHLPCIEQPEIFSELVKAFVKDIQGEGR